MPTNNTSKDGNIRKLLLGTIILFIRNSNEYSDCWMSLNYFIRFIRKSADFDGNIFTAQLLLRALKSSTKPNYFGTVRAIPKTIYIYFRSYEGYPVPNIVHSTTDGKILTGEPTEGLPLNKVHTDYLDSLRHDYNRVSNLLNM